jgi:hypothetical protein
MTREVRNVYFVDGIAAKRGLVALVAYLEEYADTDAEHARIYTFNSDTGRWGHVELEHAIVSIAHTTADGQNHWHCLSKRGAVVTITRGAKANAQIADAGTGRSKLGYVTRIRCISGDLYVCGYRRQVYRFDGAAWIHRDQGIVAERSAKAVGFNDIDGASGSDIVAVGWGGEIFHFDGSKWHQAHSPTNSNLLSVRCVGNHTCFACGENGVVLRGVEGSWEALETDGLSESLWCVEVLGNNPYFSSLENLYMLQGDRVVPVQTTAGLDFFRLSVSEDRIWSFGHEHVAYSSGAGWTEVTCPDNT